LSKSLTRKQAVRSADKAFSEYVRKRDEYCVTCGAKDRLQCGHLFSRVAYSTRWHEHNAFCQCAKCNMIHEYDPAPLTLYFLHRFGQNYYEELHSLHKTPMKFKTYQIEELARYYRRKADAC